MTTEARSRAWVWWLLGAGICLAGLLALALYAAVRLDDMISPEPPALEPRAGADDLDVPPSERGVDGGPDREIVAGSGEQAVAYEELRCEFNGEALLEPGLGSDMFDGGDRQRMTLDPGSSFSCDQNGEATSGTVEMTATFQSLDLFAGTASGPGRIRWQLLPPDKAAGHGDAPLESATTSEVELLFPEIVVWLTITDGPYEGFRGKLVLDRWELVKDLDGTIVGVRFEPTDFRISTI